MTHQKKNEIIELLAELEHEQWCEWSKALAEDRLCEIDTARLERWQRLWRPYCELNENQKDQDRVYARKVFEKIDLLSKEKEQEIEKLNKYILHSEDCILARYSAGEPTENGGYRQKFGDKWYESKPIDKTPKCDCGLDDILSKLTPSDRE